jgi:hypothetical protein
MSRSNRTRGDLKAFGLIQSDLKAFGLIQSAFCIPFDKTSTLYKVKDRQDPTLDYDPYLLPCIRHTSKRLPCLPNRSEGIQCSGESDGKLSSIPIVVLKHLSHKDHTIPQAAL